MLQRFFLSAPATGRVSSSLLVLRVVIGLAFVQYGLQKAAHPLTWADHMVALPAFVQLFVIVAELTGGLLLVVGALTPVAAILIVVDMIGAVVTFVLPHGGAKWISSSPGPTFEKNLFDAAAACAIFLAGPGAYSVDAYFARKSRS